ncbi:MAG TPA: hypothetical protein VFU22_10365 [Roseiflexaceae bacterium]|nr:hypothetical protein [Roseiflexaceae bacterium]
MTVNTIEDALGSQASSAILAADEEKFHQYARTTMSSQDYSDVSAFSFQFSAFPGWPDFTTPTRQLTLPQPTDEPEVIIEAALRLFHQIWTGEQALWLIGVGVSGLGAPPRQLSLWDVPTSADTRAACAPAARGGGPGSDPGAFRSRHGAAR